MRLHQFIPSLIAVCCTVSVPFTGSPAEGLVADDAIYQTTRSTRGRVLSEFAASVPVHGVLPELRFSTAGTRRPI